MSREHYHISRCGDCILSKKNTHFFCEMILFREKSFVTSSSTGVLISESRRCYGLLRNGFIELCRRTFPITETGSLFILTWPPFEFLGCIGVPSSFFPPRTMPPEVVCFSSKAKEVRMAQYTHKLLRSNVLFHIRVVRRCETPSFLHV